MHITVLKVILLFLDRFDFVFALRRLVQKLRGDFSLFVDRYMIKTADIEDDTAAGADCGAAVDRCRGKGKKFTRIKT